MTLDKILSSLFPAGRDIVNAQGLLWGTGKRSNGGAVQLIGVTDALPLGIDEAAQLSRHLLDVLERGGTDPILVLIDSSSQRMSKRDELLGLNEFLAHLAKCLIIADNLGHPTIGLLYGHTAAGAFIATALATRRLVALPGAQPAVMDLPSMSRVTKLSVEVLEQMARSTPVFAPGLDNFAQTGAVESILDPNRSLAEQLEALLAADTHDVTTDVRDRRGKERGGRPKAADIAERVHALASAWD